MKKSLCLAIAIAMASLNLAAQQAPTPEKQQQEIRKEVLVLLNDARMAAPELATETLIRISQSRKAANAAWRIEIIEEALRRADEVKYPLRRTLIPVKGMHVDTPPGYLSYAYDLKLDRLSLKSSVLRELLKVKKDRARQLVFEMGGTLDLKPLSCSDLLAYDVSEIYSAVGSVAKEVFSRQEVEEGLRGLFVVPWLENISSPAQIPPALDLLAQFQESDAEKFLLFAALSRAIDRNFADDRSFTDMLERGGTQNKIGRLVSGLGDESLKADLSASYRSFLLKNLRAPRCGENEIKVDSELPRYILQTNYIFREKSLKSDDVAHSDVKEKAEIVSYWRSQSSLRIRNQFRELRTAKSREGITPEEWAAMFRQAMESLNDWRTSDDESESDLFNQKSVLLRTLYEDVPDGKLREALTENFVKLLESSPIQKQSFGEWLFHARWLASKDKELFAKTAANSASPNLRLLVTLSRNQLVN